MMTSRVAAPILILALCGMAEAQLHPVLYTTIPGAPASTPPGGGAFDSFQKTAISSDGNHWALIARRVNTGGDYIIIRGTGTTGSVITQAGDALPAPYSSLSLTTGTGGNSGFNTNELSINQNAEVAYAVRSNGSPQRFLMKYGTAASIVRRGGEALPGLQTVLGGGPATGNIVDTQSVAFSSVKMLNDGTIAFQTSNILDAGGGTIVGGGTGNFNAVYTGNAASASTLLNQQSVTPVTDLSVQYVFGHEASTFAITPDGQNWAMRGHQTFGAVPAFIVKNNVKVFEFAEAVPGLPGEFFSAQSGGLGVPVFASNGDLYLPARTASDIRLVLRNGVKIAQSGDQITLTSSLNYAGTNFAVLANATSYLLNNVTQQDSTQRVLVYNGERVIVQVGDKVDVNGDGLDNDNAVVRSFGTSDAAYADDGSLLLIVNLANPSNLGTTIGSAVLKLNTSAPVTLSCSPADIAYGDGEPLPPIGQPGGFNPSGPDGGDFDCFFNFYFAAAPDNAVCDIAYGDGEPLPPFGSAGGFNPGVDGGDFDCFFNYYFNGCL